VGLRWKLGNTKPRTHPYSHFVTEKGGESRKLKRDILMIILLKVGVVSDRSIMRPEVAILI
jgi:hypothetical protein